MDTALQTSTAPRRSSVTAAAVGLLHAFVAGFLWHYFGMDSLWEMAAVKPLNAAYVFLGLFALGFVPALLYAHYDVTSPAIVVGALLTLSGVASFLLGPPVAPSAAPVPFGLYVLFWVGVVTLAAVVGAVERRAT